MRTQQSGVLKLKIADLIEDKNLLKTARDIAQNILKKDPKLELNEHQIIKRTLSSIQFESNIWNFIS